MAFVPIRESLNQAYRSELRTKILLMAKRSPVPGSYSHQGLLEELGTTLLDTP